MNVMILAVDGQPATGSPNNKALPTIKNNANAALKEFFSPEFLNRLDEIVFYKPLRKEEISKILELLIKDLERRLEDKHIKLELTQEAKDYLIENGYDEIYGARPLKRFVQKKLETLIAKEILMEKEKFKEEKEQFETYKSLELNRIKHSQDILESEKNQFEKYKEVNMKKIELENKSLEQKCDKFKELFSQFNSNFRPIVEEE